MIRAVGPASTYQALKVRIASNHWTWFDIPKLLRVKSFRPLRLQPRNLADRFWQIQSYNWTIHFFLQTFTLDRLDWFLTTRHWGCFKNQTWADSRLGTHRPVNTCDRSLVMLRWTQFPTFRWKSARWLLLRHLSSKSVWMRRLEALGCILRLIFWYKEQASSTWLKSLQMLRRIRPQWPSWTVCSYHGQGSLSWVPVYIPATGYLEFPGMGLLHVASWMFNLFRKADLSLEATQILATGSPLCAVDQDNCWSCLSIGYPSSARFKSKSLKDGCCNQEQDQAGCFSCRERMG